LANLAELDQQPQPEPPQQPPPELRRKLAIRCTSLFMIGWEYI
jgi:hypothetical protein